MRIGVLILRINQKRIDLEAAKVEAEGLEKSLTELKEKKKELEIKQLEVTGKLNEAAKLEKQSGIFTDSAFIFVWVINMFCFYKFLVTYFYFILQHWFVRVKNNQMFFFVDKLKMQMETIKAKVADLENRLGQEYEKSTDELREEIKSSKDVVGEQKKTLDRVRFLLTILSPQ